MIVYIENQGHRYCIFLNPNLHNKLFKATMIKIPNTINKRFTRTNQYIYVYDLKVLQ